MGRFRTFLSALLLSTAASAQGAFINEIHYDNTGTDVGEGIEVAGTAGTSLADFEIVFYNGSGGRPYRTVALDGVIPDEAGGAGAVWFDIPGIQNGDPDGAVLYNRTANAVVHLIAWDGMFTGTSGIAEGLIFPDIGIGETSGTPPGNSLQLTGDTTDPSDFRWTGPRPASPGRINAGQTIQVQSGPQTAMAVVPGLVREGEFTHASIVLNPPPVAPVVAVLTAEPHGLVSIPSAVTVDSSGTATFRVEALADWQPDGFREVILRANPENGTYPPAAGALQIVDADRPARTSDGFIRLVTMNVRLGAGVPGSPEFVALREVIERLSPDILLLQEVHEANGFADVRMLLQQAGFPDGPQHVAVEGDAFAGMEYSGGDFNVSQSVVTASRWPVTRTVQIGRGEPGRREIARFPLFTVIRVPGEEDGLAVVNVHFKAADTEADRFRRSVEAYRVRTFLAAEGLTGTSNVVIAGDCNASDFIPQTESFLTAIDPATHRFSDGSGFPATYQLGADLTTGGGVSIPYSVFPHSAFAPLQLAAVPAVQPDGSVYTFGPAAFRLDYVFLPQALLDSGNVFAQVWNSRLHAEADGLPCRIDPVDPALSDSASDHYPVVVDFRMRPLPRPGLTVVPDSIEEGATDAELRISMDPPPNAPVTVTVGAWRDGRVRAVPSRVELSPGAPAATVPLEVPHLPVPHPHRDVTLIASAPGFAPALTALEVRDREATGLLVISQYTQPLEGVSPRAMELLNLSGEMVDFGRTRLEVRLYSNGSNLPETLVNVRSGLLPDGAVLVAGDATTGNYLVAQGRIPAPATPFNPVPDGSVFPDAQGNIAFVKVPGIWDGNDAIEIVCGGYRSDVFGTIGDEPGRGWASETGDLSTAGGNLSLRPELLTGSAGFRDPALRFVRTEGSALTGFGLPPPVHDAYFAWLADAGYTGAARAPNADPARSGTANLLRWILDGGFPPVLNGAEWVAVTKTPDPGTTVTWEESADLNAWTTPGGLAFQEREDGFTEWRWPVRSIPAGKRFHRLVVRRP